MAVYLNLIDYDDAFAKTQTGVTLVNDLNPTLIEDKAKLLEQLVTYYDGDTLSVIPSCKCGHLYGAFRQKSGLVCPLCKTRVQQDTEKDIESSVWMKAPEGTPGFIHPALYTLLRKSFTKNGVCVIDWLCRSSRMADVSKSKAVDWLKASGFRRGLSEFHAQLDRFIDECFSSKVCSAGSKKERLDLQEFLRQNKHLLFCQYLPIPSKIAFVIEEEATVGYVDQNAYKCLDAVTTVLGIKLAESGDAHNEGTRAARLRRREDRTFMASVQLADFYREFITENIGKKPGWLRKHVFGSRLNFTFRGVISSISEPHHYEDLHLPWGIGVNIFSLHITNKLLCLGFTPKSASRLIAEFTNAYHPLLDKLLKEIIAAHPLGKWPVIFQRNPTLSRLSAQCLFVTKVKTDPSIRSISMSLLVLRGPNADGPNAANNKLLLKVVSS